MIQFLQTTIKVFTGSKTIVALSIVQGFATVILISLPLFRDFDYEFNAVLCVVTFITSSAAGIAVLRKSGDREGEKAVAIGKRNGYIFFEGAAISGMNAAGSLAIVGVSFLFHEVCGIARGLQFFVLLPAVAAVVGSGLGYLIASVFQKKAWTCFFIVMTISFLLNLFWLVWQVPIFVYSVFWGYFAGPIYDEWIPITGTLIVHRIGALGFGLLFYFAAALWNKTKARLERKGEGVLTAAMLILLGVWYLQKSSVGFDVSYDELKSRLAGRINSEHVQLIFDQSIPENEMRWIGLLSEFYYCRIDTFLHLKSKRAVKIYVYADALQKKKIMGAGKTNFSKIWNDEIHINFEDAEAVLQHEMTHILANDFGRKYFGTGRVGFLEGVAVACDWNEQFFTPHEWAAALERRNELPDILSLIHPWGFFQSYSRLSYTVCGSFTRFLIDTYGVEKFKQVYTDADFESVYGKRMERLVDEWSAFLKTLPVSSEDIHLAGLLSQSSIFEKKCVHCVADILESANEAYRENRYDDAAAGYARALRIDRQNPRILFAKIRSLYYAQQYDESDLDSLVVGQRLNYVSLATAKLLKGDMRLQTGHTDSARSMYQDIIDHYRNVSSVYIAACMRMQFVSDSKSGDLKTLMAMEKAPEQISLVETNTASAVARYWMARIYFQRGAYVKAAALLEKITWDDRVLELDRLNMLAESLLRVNRLEEAIRCWDEARKFSERKMDNENIDHRMELALWLQKQNFN